MSARDEYPKSAAYAAYYAADFPKSQAAEADRMLDEIDTLRRWKAEATEVILGWERVWEACGRPGPLGGSKSENLLQALRGDGVIK